MLKAEWERGGALRRIEWTWPWAKAMHAVSMLDVTDVGILLGLAGMAVGLFLLAPWLAFFVVGSVVFLISLVVAVLRARSDLIEAAARRSQQG